MFILKIDAVSCKIKKARSPCCLLGIGILLTTFQTYYDIRIIVNSYNVNYGKSEIPTI